MQTQDSHLFKKKKEYLENWTDVMTIIISTFKLNYKSDKTDEFGTSWQSSG